MFVFASETPLDPKGDSLAGLISRLGRSRFPRRLVDHRYQHVTDPQGNVVRSPDYDSADPRS